MTMQPRTITIDRADYFTSFSSITNYKRYLIKGDGYIFLSIFSPLVTPRSASAVIAYRMHRDGLSYDDALATVRTVRPSARPNEGFVKQLRDLEAKLRCRV